MTRATDLRYGRRGGGWIPTAPTKETQHPHLYRLGPCPRRDCAGQIQYPRDKATSPYEATCDGTWPHTFDCTPLAPHTTTTEGLR
jgi:hypothetical protein